MKRLAVDSRAIRSVGYEVATKTLELEFAAGTVYQYLNVAEFTFRALMTAKSKQAFFSSSIEGRHICRQVR